MNTEITPEELRKAAFAEAVEACVNAIDAYGSSSAAIRQVEEDYDIKFTRNEDLLIREDAAAEWRKVQRAAGVTPLTSEQRAKAFRDLR